MHFTVEAAKLHGHLHERNIDVTLLKRPKGILWIFRFVYLYFLILLQSIADIGSCALAPALALAVCAKVMASSHRVAVSTSLTLHGPALPLPHNINSDLSMKMNNFPMAEWTQIGDLGRLQPGES